MSIKVIASGGGKKVETEEKTVTAGTSAQAVTPSEGKYLSKVIVNPTPSQEKSVTPTPNGSSVLPDAGKMLNKVTLNPFALEGQYVWKKYEHIPADSVTNPSFTLDIKSYSTVHQITNENFDLTKLGEKWKEFFNGFTTDGNGFTLSNGILEFSSKSFISFDPINKTLTTDDYWRGGTICDFSYNGTKVFTEEQRIFQSYVISDNENAYPDDGMQDGCWYKKIPILTQYGVLYREVNADGKPTDLVVNMENIPQYFFVFNNGAKIYTDVEKLELISGTVATTAFSGFGSDNPLTRVKIKCKTMKNQAMYGSPSSSKIDKIWISNLTETLDGQPFCDMKPTGVFYCEATSKPSGWATTWNKPAPAYTCSVVWGVTETEFDAL